MAEKQNGVAKTLMYFGIPLIITIIFLLFILNFLGVPVLETAQNWGNKVPGLSMLIPDASTKAGDSGKDAISEEQKDSNSEDELKDQQQKIAELTEQLESSKKSVNDLKQTNHSLQLQLDEKQSKESEEQLKKVANVYANIPPAKAAAMFETMSLEDASITLSQLPQNVQSSILGSMKNANYAAQITMVVKEMVGLDDSDPAVLSQQVHEIVQNQQTPTDLLTETIAEMPAAQSAQIIQTMMGTNSQVAITLLKGVNTSSRSQILTQIAKNDANLAAQITASLN